MQQFFDKQELQRIQDDLCYLSHTIGYCVTDNGEKFTEMSGNKEGIELILKEIPEDNFYYLFKRISDSKLEDIIVEDTKYDNVKIAAVYLNDKSRQTFCWLLCCVLNDCEGDNLLQTSIEKISLEDFYAMLELLVAFQHKLYHIGNDLLTARAENERSKCSETEMSQSLKRTEAITEILQFLESNESFEQMADDIMRIVGEYLLVGDTLLYKVARNDNYVDIVATYRRDQELHFLQPTQGIERNDLLLSEKPMIISTDTLVSAGVRGCMLKQRITAYIAIPIYFNEQIAMYLCVDEHVPKRVWMIEDVKFLNDIAKILQSILGRRIQKNSLASSYASIQGILDNVGTCIYVKDHQTGKCLYANNQLKHTFEKELNERTLDALLQTAKPIDLNEGLFELTHKDMGCYYDLHQKDMTWVDGKKVALYALYDVSDKKIYQKKIEQQAYTDFLTGLYNRMCCERDLAAQVDRAHNTRTNGALLYMDLDDFKDINDGLGHQYGDVLLQSISHAFQRIEGIKETCYRMGGDEFVIIIPPESFKDAEQIIHEIKEIFAKPWFLKDADYYCTMSMGICHFPEDGDNVAELIKKADIAMYEAKKTGKNRVVKYCSSFNTLSNRRLDMEKNMRDATSGNYSEFNVYFQPIIDIQKDGTPCTGAEALVRWNSAALGFIPPSDFIPLAEYLGLITPIGNYVLREACYACKKWNDNGHPEYKVNVNLSVVQLLQSDITSVVENALHDTGINPRNLTLEVTESLAINDMERMKVILNSIRELGVRIALDDFGTGYSSLNHIREIPLDVIKVDQSFVSDLAEDEYSQSFIKMVAELASAINVSICVEGIETKEQYKVLENMKVQLVQGYYFDRPIPRDEFERKYVLENSENEMQIDTIESKTSL